MHFWIAAIFDRLVVVVGQVSVILWRCNSEAKQNLNAYWLLCKSCRFFFCIVYNLHLDSTLCREKAVLSEHTQVQTSLMNKIAGLEQEKENIQNGTR